MNRYESLKNDKSAAMGQLDRITSIRKALGMDERAVLGAHGTNSFMVVPDNLHDDYVALLDRCSEHYQAVIAEADKRIAACETLLAGFEATS